LLLRISRQTVKLNATEPLSAAPNAYDILKQDKPMIYKVDSFIAAAEKHAASDIHLTTDERPRMRINGKLRTLGGDETILSQETILGSSMPRCRGGKRNGAHRFFRKTGRWTIPMKRHWETNPCGIDVRCIARWESIRWRCGGFTMRFRRLND
jgi:hypothetical protein